MEEKTFISVIELLACTSLRWEYYGVHLSRFQNCSVNKF